MYDSVLTENNSLGTFYMVSLTVVISERYIIHSFLNLSIEITSWLESGLGFPVLLFQNYYLDI